MPPWREQGEEPPRGHEGSLALPPAASSSPAQSISNSPVHIPTLPQLLVAPCHIFCFVQLSHRRGKIQTSPHRVLKSLWRSGEVENSHQAAPENLILNYLSALSSAGALPTKPGGAGAASVCVCEQGTEGWGCCEVVEHSKQHPGCQTLSWGVVADVEMMLEHGAVLGTEHSPCSAPGKQGETDSQYLIFSEGSSLTTAKAAKKENENLTKPSSLSNFEQTMPCLESCGVPFRADAPHFCFSSEMLSLQFRHRTSLSPRGSKGYRLCLPQPTLAFKRSSLRAC